MKIKIISYEFSDDHNYVPVPNLQEKCGVDIIIKYSLKQKAVSTSHSENLLKYYV